MPSRCGWIAEIDEGEMNMELDHGAYLEKVLGLWGASMCQPVAPVVSACHNSVAPSQQPSSTYTPVVFQIQGGPSSQALQSSLRCAVAWVWGFPTLSRSLLSHASLASVSEGSSSRQVESLARNAVLWVELGFYSFCEGPSPHSSPL